MMSLASEAMTYQSWLAEHVLGEWSNISDAILELRIPMVAFCLSSSPSQLTQPPKTSPLEQPNLHSVNFLDYSVPIPSH
jgi:hypothetical protein